MSGVLVAMANVAQQPVVHTYNTGTAATENVPAGAILCVIEGWGGGASGACRLSGNAGGGAGGSYFKKTIAVVTGNSFTYTVGPLGASVGPVNNGNPGGSTTVSGTVAGGSVSLATNQAGGGTSAAGGTPSTPTGGDVNTAGSNGTFAAPGLGGNAAPPGGGSGGASDGASGTAPGGGGAADDTGLNSGSGATGRVRFTYTF